MPDPVSQRGEGGLKRVLTIVLALLFLAGPALAAVETRMAPKGHRAKALAFHLRVERIGRRIPASQQAWQYRWEVWLPDKWRRVANCETHLNWHHQNAGYVSAFGISRRAYDEDAAVMGAPPWNDRRNPTPWHQFRAALGHYRLHGGFSGWGCRGA